HARVARFDVRAWAFSFRGLHSRSGRCCGSHGLQVELDLDALADEHAACFEHLIPLETEVLAVDRRARDEAASLVAPRILASAERLDVERDLAGDAANREIADHAMAVLPGGLDLLARESELGVLLGVEEVRRAQVPVALPVAGVDARGVD